MAKISRYITREFLLYFLTCLMSLLAITVVFSALAELRLLEKPDGVSLFFEAVLSGIPLLIEIITPISVLLATVLAFSTLSKSSEIVAMMAAGISLFRLVLPILITGVLISAFTYFNQSYLAPWWGADKRVSVVKSSLRGSSWQFYRGKLYFFSGLSKRHQKVEVARIYGFSQEYELESVNNLNNLTRLSDSWTVSNGDKLSIADTKAIQSLIGEKTYASASFPTVFKKELSHPKYSDIPSLVNEIRLKRQGAVDFENDLFALYQKLSNIVTIFIMILLALPFSLFGGRSSNIRTGIVISVIIGFTFWFSDQIFVSLRSTGNLPAEVSAFAANFLFLLIFFGLIRLRRV